jgi:hypothetical protein
MRNIEKYKIFSIFSFTFNINHTNFKLKNKIKLNKVNIKLQKK